MTTTIADLEAVLPASDRARYLEDLRRRLDETAGRVMRTARASGRARHALDGEHVGLELNNRVAAMVQAAQAHQMAIDEWMIAEAVLAEAEKEEA